jgi:hypothetical protein
MTTSDSADQPKLVRHTRKRNPRQRISINGEPTQRGNESRNRSEADSEQIKNNPDITAEEAARNMPEHRHLLGDGKRKRTGRNADEFEQFKRIKQTVQMIVHGATRRQAVDWLVATYRISDRHADRYVRAAKEELVAQWEIDRPEMLATLLAQSLHVYAETTRSGQYGTALTALQFQSRLVKLT